MDLFLHTCCAPCLSGSRLQFEEEGFDITAFWYNPNIAPYTEHMKRLQTLQRYLYLEPLKVIEEEGYSYLSFDQMIIREVYKGGTICDAQFMTEEERKVRCKTCYKLRMGKTAEKARESGFDSFSTTLLLSKHQDHEEIRSVCREVSSLFEIEFIYQDLRKNWKDSIRISRKLNLYRQPYCGCIFSENERYLI